MCQILITLFIIKKNKGVNWKILKFKVLRSNQSFCNLFLFSTQNCTLYPTSLKSYNSFLVKLWRASVWDSFFLSLYVCLFLKKKIIIIILHCLRKNVMCALTRVMVCICVRIFFFLSTVRLFLPPKKKKKKNRHSLTPLHSTFHYHVPYIFKSSLSVSVSEPQTKGHTHSLSLSHSFEICHCRRQWSRWSSNSTRSPPWSSAASSSNPESPPQSTSTSASSSPSLLSSPKSPKP